MAKPVRLGPVEGVTPGSLRLGPSLIGASASDPTTVEAAAVEVRFNLLKTLWSRQLELDINVIRPQGYAAQDPKKGWITVQIKTPEKPRQEWFKIRVDRIRVIEGQLALQPYVRPSSPRRPVELTRVNGTIDVDYLTLHQKEAQRFQFDLTAAPVNSGSLRVKGEVEPIAAAVDLPLQQMLNLSVQGKGLPLTDVAAFTLSTVRLEEAPLTVRSGRVSGSYEMRLRPNQPIDMRGTVRVTEGDLAVAQLPTRLRQIQAQARFQASKIILDRVTAAYGGLTPKMQGIVDLESGYDLVAQVERADLARAAQTLKLTLPVPASGTLAATATLTGALDQPQLTGSIRALDSVKVDRLQLDGVATQFALVGQALRFENLVATPQLGGALTGRGQVYFSQDVPFAFQLQGRDLPADVLAQAYSFEPPFSLGRLAADATLRGNAQGSTTAVQWRVPEARYPGQGKLTLAKQGLILEDTVFQVGGGTFAGSGTVAQGRWQADITANRVSLNQINPAVPGQLAGRFQLAGPTQNFSVAGLQGQGNFQIQQLAAGSLIGSAKVQQGRWQADVTASGLQLEQLNPNLQGGASGRFQLAGVTDDLSLAAIQAQGTLSLARGVAAFAPQLGDLHQPLTSTVAWDGQQVLIRQARSAQLQAQGTVTPQVNGFQIEGIEGFDLRLSADHYALAAAPLPLLPAWARLDGLAGFEGRLTGSPSQPVLVGALQLQNLAVNQVIFEPYMAGQVDLSPGGGLTLSVAGERDAIAIQSTPEQPLAFRIDWQAAFAQGDTQGDWLNLQIGNFPIAALEIPLPEQLSPIGNVLQGTIAAADLAVNLAQQNLVGEVDIRQPGLGYIHADRFAGQIRYVNSLATLTGGELVLGDSLYRINGRLALSDNPSYQADIQADEGNIQDLLTALSIFEFEDFQRGLQPPDWLGRPLPPGALATQPAGNPQATLLDQIRRLAEIQALQAQQAEAAAAAPIPPLQSMQGQFTGTVKVAGSARSGTDLAFNLQGANWQWGERYTADRVIAEGEIKQGVLILEPLRVESSFAVAEPRTEPSTAGAAGTPPALTKQAVVSLAGQFALGRSTDGTSNLQLTASDLPVETVRDVLNLPLSLEGWINATATLSGDLANPILRGSVEIADAGINQQPIETAEARFLYQDARFSLLSTLVAPNNPEPLRVTAQVPYAFDFMDVQPSDDTIFLDVKVKDEGLALLNVLSPQLSWESGKGEVQFYAEGPLSNLNRLTVTGSADIQEAQIRAKFLPEPLTNVQGTARFEAGNLIVDRFSGDFKTGQLEAAGTFPLLSAPIISAPDLAALGDAVSATPQPLKPQGPLTINLEEIALNLPDLYDGTVNGQIVVGGSLLRGPRLGGKVLLSDGRIFLPDGSSTPVAASAAANGAAAAPSPIILSELQNLQIRLGRSVRIIQGSLLDFLAEGELQLDGPLDNIKPLGLIRLPAGTVNLFTTQFRLAQGDNTVEFLPNRGLQDPLLNIELRTSATETVQRIQVATVNPLRGVPPAEIPDRPVDIFSDTPGSIRTIRIRARVTGPASQIFDNLIFSSSPPRSQSEILALIGGVDALELAGNGSFNIYNLVGGALLGWVEGLVGRNLDLSEFRLFPVTPATQSSADSGLENSFNFGAEVGVDVTNNATVSVQKVLTNSTPAEFNLRYRLTDGLTLRSTTNFGDINRVLIEFETRF
jgi:translocation and assembly module TamB